MLSCAHKDSGKIKFSYRLPIMKKCGLFAASVAAASATAISASSTTNFACNSNFQASHEDVASKEDHENSTMQRSSSTEKFAPRFDGLRFIETLVTAHR